MLMHDLQITLIALNNLINKQKKQVEKDGYDINLSPFCFCVKEIKREKVNICSLLKTRGHVPNNFSLYLKRLNILCHRGNDRIYIFTIFYNDWLKLKDKLLSSFVNPNLKILFLLDKPLEDVEL